MRAFSPKFTYSDLLAHGVNSGPELPLERVLDEMIQINLVEIRSLILQKLLRPVVQVYYVGSERDKVCHILDTLLSDECKHIEYSARSIQWLAEECGPSKMQELLALRQNDLNAITLSELDEHSFE
jgi:uncharacterized ferritin-like protein (DUF455 family)